MQEGVQNVVHVVFEVGAIVGAYVGGFYVAANGLSMLGGAGKALGNMFSKAGGGLQGAIGSRKETNAFAIRRQLGKEAKKAQRVEAGAGAVAGEGIRGGIVSRVGNRVGTRRQRTRRARVQTQAAGYTADQQKQALGKINYQHAQALSMANGDMAQAAQILQDQGMDANGLADTATAVQQGGINLNNASTAQALGDVAAETGTLVAGYGNRYQQIAGRGGQYQASLAAGTAQQWIRTTRGKSNFAADERTGIARLGSFGNTAAADIDAILARTARNQERLNNGGTLNTDEDPGADARHAQDLERLARYTAKAELAREAGDKSIDEHRWRSIEQGRAQIAQHAPNFDNIVQARRQELEQVDRARAEF